MYEARERRLLFYCAVDKAASIPGFFRELYSQGIGLRKPLELLCCKDLPQRWSLRKKDEKDAYELENGGAGLLVLGVVSIVLALGMVGLLVPFLLSKLLNFFGIYLKVFVL